MKKITGRKLLSLVLCGSMLASVLAGCGGQEAETTPSATPSEEATQTAEGTYTGTAEGFGGEVSVTLTVSGGAITDVDAQGDGETEDVGKAALPDLAAAILEAQGPNIDGVSGATITSDAVKEATKAAMEQAGLTVEEAPTGENEEITADVLVIGMGASGTMAALNAAEAGAKVVGVESTGALGGMGNAAQGMFAIGTSLQHERYGDDLGSDEEYWYEKLMDQSNQLGNAQLIRTFVSEAKNTVEYLLDKGVKVYLSKTAQQIAHFDETIIYHRWNNADPFTYLGQALDENGVDIRYNTTATQLLTDESGAVTGAVCAKADGGTLTVKAGAVVVSTGGFAGNEEMMRQALGDKLYDTVKVSGGGYDGAGIQMMYDVGAAQGELLTMNHGMRTKTDGIEVADELTLNTPILWVNHLGQRFMNEDLLKDTVEYSSAVLAQGGYAYTIVDQATVDRWCDSSYENTGSWIHWWDRVGIIGEDGERTVYHAPIDGATFASDFEKLTESGNGKICESLDEVAEFIGCDPDTLKDTVSRYNGYVASGVDEEFFKSAESLIYSVEEGPFYVTKGYNVVLGALGGVNVTSELQVVDEDMDPIQGLYATGNNCSGVSVAAYVNVEGVGLGFALTSGRLAGANAAAAVLGK